MNDRKLGVTSATLNIQHCNAVCFTRRGVRHHVDQYEKADEFTPFAEHSHGRDRRRCGQHIAYTLRP